jgi:hypothetical protein
MEARKACLLSFEFGIPLKLVRLINMCLNETYRAQVGKHSSDTAPIKNGLKHDALSPLLVNFALEYAIRRVQAKPGGLEIKWYTSASSLC